MKDREYNATFIGTKDGRPTIRHMKITHVGEHEFKGHLTTKTAGFLKKQDFDIPDLWARPHWKTEFEGDMGNWHEEIIFLFDPITLEPAPFPQLMGLDEALKFKDSMLRNKEHALNAWRMLSALGSNEDLRRKLEARFAEDFGETKKKLQPNPFSDLYGGGYR